MRELRIRVVPTALLVAGLAAFAWVADAQMVRPGGPQVPFGPCPPPDNRQPISALPFTIDSCGSYFLVDCLTGNPGQNGITIEADDVTLDLNGFTLAGVPGSGSGVQVQPGFSGITIEGGGIFGWDVNGIDAENGEAVRVRRL